MRHRAAAGAMLLALLLSGCAPPAPTARPQEPAPVLSAPESAVASRPANGIEPSSFAGTEVDRAGRRMTVRMRSVGCRGVGTGSGFIVDDTLIVTNRHVVEDAVVLQLNTWDGRTFDALLTAVAYADDLALVRVSRELPVTGALADGNAVAGTPITVVGYPHGGQLVQANGRILEYAPLEGHDGASRVMRLSATVQPGNSGGPVLDDAGSVVGVVFGTEPATGNGLAIPASAVRGMLADSQAPAAPPTC